MQEKDDKMRATRRLFEDEKKFEKRNVTTKLTQFEGSIDMKDTRNIIDVYSAHFSGQFCKLKF